MTIIKMGDVYVDPMAVEAITDGNSNPDQSLLFMRSGSIVRCVLSKEDAREELRKAFCEPDYKICTD